MSVRVGRLVGAALRCYPAQWRRRHAAEAAELASLLIADGIPAASIAWSYLAGAVRAWLAPRPGRSLSTAAAGLLAAMCLLGFSAALIAQTAPARAASTTQSPSGPILSTTKPASPGAAPYSPRQFTPCQSVLPGQVTGAIPAAGPRPAGIPGTAHARSC